MSAIAKAIGPLVNIALLLLFAIIIFAIIGLEFYAGALNKTCYDIQECKQQQTKCKQQQKTKCKQQQQTKCNQQQQTKCKQQQTNCKNNNKQNVNNNKQNVNNNKQNVKKQQYQNVNNS